MTKPWDLSRGKYAEGVSKVGMLLPMATKVVTNVMGATAAVGGYGLGKLETSTKKLVGNMVGSSSWRDAEMSDSAAFRVGFTSWLWSNGIFPSVAYLDHGYDTASRRCRQLYFPEEEPPRVPMANDMKQTPLIVSNHICYLDGVILAAVFGAPKVVAKSGTLDTPLIGRFAQEIGVVEVDRENKDSRAATLTMIQ